jgi:hypothetical protein
MPSCNGINIVAAAGFGCVVGGLAEADVTARGLAGVTRAGFATAAGAGFALAARTGAGAAGRSDLDAAGRVGLAAGVLAVSTLEAVDGRVREPVFTGLRAAAGAGFDATFFTSTSTVRKPGPGSEARPRTVRGIPSRAKTGGQSAAAPPRRLARIIARPTPQ